jgi:hypothetical protein
MPNLKQNSTRRVADFPLVHSVYGEDNPSTVVFIGGSTMAGKGITSSAYPKLFSEATGLSVSVYTKFLIKLNDVISLIQSANISDAILFINCGAGDQQRVLNPILRKVLPAHWSLPAHMEAPIRFSIETRKRVHQKGTLFIKYLVKYISKYFGLYPNTTKLATFRVELQQLSLVAHQRKLTIFWIDTALGDFRIPPFVRREKALYCRNLVQENLRTFPTGSNFLTLEGKIESNDLLDDAFHLNDVGHKKMSTMLQAVYDSKLK